MLSYYILVTQKSPLIDSAENTAYVLSTLERFHAHNASPDHIWDLDSDKAEPPEGVMWFLGSFDEVELDSDKVFIKKYFFAILLST